LISPAVGSVKCFYLLQYISTLYIHLNIDLLGQDSCNNYVMCSGSCVRIGIPVITCRNNLWSRSTPNVNMSFPEHLNQLTV